MFSANNQANAHKGCTMLNCSCEPHIGFLRGFILSIVQSCTAVSYAPYKTEKSPAWLAKLFN